MYGLSVVQSSQYSPPGVQSFLCKVFPVNSSQCKVFPVQYSQYSPDFYSQHSLPSVQSFQYRLPMYSLLGVYSFSSTVSSVLSPQYCLLSTASSRSPQYGLLSTVSSVLVFSVLVSSVLVSSVLSVYSLPSVQPSRCMVFSVLYCLHSVLFSQFLPNVLEVSVSVCVVTHNVRAPRCILLAL